MWCVESRRSVISSEYLWWNIDKHVIDICIERTVCSTDKYSQGRLCVVAAMGNPLGLGRRWYTVITRVSKFALILHKWSLLWARTVMNRAFLREAIWPDNIVSLYRTPYSVDTTWCQLDTIFLVLDYRRHEVLDVFYNLWIVLPFAPHSKSSSLLLPYVIAIFHV